MTRPGHRGLSVCGFCIWLLQCCYNYPDKVHFSRLQLDSVRTQADLAETEGSQEDRSGCRERGAKTTPVSCTPRWVTSGHQGDTRGDSHGTQGDTRADQGGQSWDTWWGQKNRGQSWGGGSGTSLRYGSTTITPAWYFGQIQFLRIRYLIGVSE